MPTRELLTPIQLLFAAALLLTRSESRHLSVLTGYVLCAVAAGLLLRPADPIAAVLTSPLLLEFLAGAWLASWHRQRRAAPLLGLLLILAAAALFAWLPPPGIEPLRRIAGFGIPALLLVMGALSFEPSRIGPLGRIGVAVGNASYSLYLSHWLVLHAVGWLWQRSGLHGDAALAFFAAAAAVGYALLTWRYVERELGARIMGSLRALAGVAAARPVRADERA